MNRWLPYLILAVIGSLALAMCHSCSGREDKEPLIRKFPTRRAAFTLPTPRRRAQVPAGEVVRLPTPARRSPVQAPAASREVELPADFPADIPLFEGAKPFAVQELAGNARNVLFQSEADRPEIFSFYKKEMQQQGWKPTQEYQAGYQSFLSFKKGKMITNVTISTDPKTGKRVVGIMYQEEEDLPFKEF